MLHAITLGVWYSGVALLAAVGGAMWWRKFVREYPVFFAYILSQLVRFSVLFPIYLRHDQVLYRKAFTGMEAIDALLSFAVMYELFRITFERYEGIRQMGSMILRWAVVLLLALAAIAAASSPKEMSGQNPLTTALFAAENGIGIMRAGLLFLLFGFYHMLGLRWSRLTYGIALGFGLVTSVQIITVALRAQLGPAFGSALSIISSASFDLAVLEWLYAVAQRDSERPRPPRPAKWDVDAWNRAILELLQR